MNIYTKLLVTIVPLVSCFLVAAVGTTYYFSQNAIVAMAHAWLDTRVAEALQFAQEQEDNLRTYQLSDIPASVTKAQIDAARAIAGISVGDKGYIFAVDTRGTITMHPDSAMVGVSVTGESWFQTLACCRGRVTLTGGGGRNLAAYSFYPPWEWFFMAVDSEKEIRKAAEPMKTYLVLLGVAMAAVMAVALMLLTRRLTAPIRDLMQGVDRIGRGDLATRITVTSSDECGRLAVTFNRMADDLQATLHTLRQSHSELEQRVAERTAELIGINTRLTHEIEERKEMIRQKEALQAQLLRARKMEAIGTLAGGIAHDFNNLLMGIQGNASIVLMETGPHHPHAKRLEMIESFVQSGAGLTRQLLGFARLGKYELRVTDVNALIQRSSEMFGRTRKELSIYRRYQPDGWAVEVDQGQIEQVLINMYINAWQSMPGGGSIFLETQNVVLDEAYVRQHGASPGRYVKISVTDTGAGIDPTIQERIFDPFFTTKTRKRGTGLGLASAYGIIQNHGGLITVYSEVGQGTTFNIYLPAHDEKALVPDHVAETPQKGNETLLLVDDEPHILEITAQMLVKLGYTVLKAHGGKEALEMAQRYQDVISLVILDMIMPDMGGGETFDCLRRIDPGIKVLLASGYSINGEASEILGRGCNGFIQKPFSLVALSHEVRKVLDEAVTRV